MESIVSLIIVLFKLPKWIEPNNPRLMLNRHPYVKRFVVKHYDNFDWCDISIQPVMADVILQNKHRAISSYLFQNPSPKLTDLIKIKFTPVLLAELATNTNPELAELIMSNKNKFNQQCWANIGKNPNPGLTKFIIENYPTNIKPLYLIANPNPELASLIMANKIRCYDLVNNSNPGLTDLIISIGRMTYDNTNPKLAPYIMRLLSRRKIQFNEDLKYISSNTNHGLEKFIYDNRDKLSLEYFGNLASNRYIVEKITFDKPRLCVML